MLDLSQDQRTAQLPIKHRTLMAASPLKTHEDEHSVFARPSFYAEFAPRVDHAAFVDSIYVLKDRGRLTESRASFASPLKELTFIFREDGPGGKIVFHEPRLDHRTKVRPFFGWILGVKFKPDCLVAPSLQDPVVAACRDALARAFRSGTSRSEVLEITDRTLSEILRQGHGLRTTGGPLNGARGRVSDLADQAGKSVRTLQRQVRASTGSAPKRFLAAQRFRRSFYEVAAADDGLSAIASDLGFSDQAHLTREFQRHTGVTPGAFRQVGAGPARRLSDFFKTPADPRG